MLIDFKINSGKKFIIDLWIDSEIATTIMNGSDIAEYQARISCSNELGEFWAYQILNMFKATGLTGLSASNTFRRISDWFTVKRIMPQLFNEKTSGVLCNQRVEILAHDNC